MQDFMQNPDFMSIIQNLAGKFGGDTGKFEDMLKEKAAGASGPDDLMNILKGMMAGGAGGGGGNPFGGGHTEL